MRKYPWSLYYDEQHKAYYWYNCDTEESEWKIEENNRHNADANADADADADTGIALTPLHHKQLSPFIDTPSNQRNAEDISREITPLVEHHAISRKSVRTNFQQFLANEMSTTSNTNRNGSNGVLQEDLEATEENRWTQAVERTKRDVTLFSVGVIVHSALIEQPLACIECLLRGAVFLVVAAAVFIFTAISAAPRTDGLWGCSAAAADTVPLFKEAVVSLASSLTLAVPGMAISVYRRFWSSDDADWVLCPLPTLAGYVDIRRFVVFSYGNGSYATNINLDPQQSPCMDSWRPDVMTAVPRQLALHLGEIWVHHEGDII